MINKDDSFDKFKETVLEIYGLAEKGKFKNFLDQVATLEYEGELRVVLLKKIAQDEKIEAHLATEDKKGIFKKLKQASNDDTLSSFLSDHESNDDLQEIVNNYLKGNTIDELSKDIKKTKYEKINEELLNKFLYDGYSRLTEASKNQVNKFLFTIAKKNIEAISHISKGTQGYNSQAVRVAQNRTYEVFDLTLQRLAEPWREMHSRRSYTLEKITYQPEKSESKNKSWSFWDGLGYFFKNLVKTGTFKWKPDDLNKPNITPASLKLSQEGCWYDLSALKFQNASVAEEAEKAIKQNQEAIKTDQKTLKQNKNTLNAISQAHEEIKRDTEKTTTKLEACEKLVSEIPKSNPPSATALDHNDNKRESSDKFNRILENLKQFMDESNYDRILNTLNDKKNDFEKIAYLNQKINCILKEINYTPATGAYNLQKLNSNSPIKKAQTKLEEQQKIIKKLSDFGQGLKRKINTSQQRSKNFERGVFEKIVNHKEINTSVILE